MAELKFISGKAALANFIGDTAYEWSNSIGSGTYSHFMITGSYFTA